MVGDGEKQRLKSGIFYKDDNDIANVISYRVFIKNFLKCSKTLIYE